MQILLIYIVTVILSFIFELDNGFTMFKDVADAGYKIDIDKMSEFTNKIKSNQKNNSLLRLLIPFYNVFKAMQIRMQYNQQKVLILEQLSVMDCIEEMTEEEKIEYAKKPTGLNAVLVPIKLRLEMSKAIKIELKEEGNIWFVFDEKADDIKIVKAEGAVAKLSPEEQKERVNKANGQLATAIVENFGTFENFKNEIQSSAKNTNGYVQMDISSKTISEKIDELKELREELTQPEAQEEKGNQKINKKDK